jgi:hypothetical protein
MPNAPKTPTRPIRVDDDLWEEFGEATAEQDTNRSEALREFIRWYVRKPGARMPERPPRGPDSATSRRVTRVSRNTSDRPGQRRKPGGTERP